MRLKSPSIKHAAISSSLSIHTSITDQQRMKQSKGHRSVKQSSIRISGKRSKPKSNILLVHISLSELNRIRRLRQSLLNLADRDSGWWKIRRIQGYSTKASTRSLLEGAQS